MISRNGKLTYVCSLPTPMPHLVLGPCNNQRTGTRPAPLPISILDPLDTCVVSQLKQNDVTIATFTPALRTMNA